MLAARDGVGANQVALPEGSWTSLIDFLVERFPAIPATEWAARMARGDVVDASGARVQPQQAYQPRGRLYYYREVPDEKPNPAQAQLLFEDEWLIVADKPHFLPVTPSGPYLQETLLVRLRRQSGIDDLAPLHRIDRETAGIVLFAKQAETRSRYTTMFARREVTKTYQAIAPFRADMAFPLTHASHLETANHFMQMREARDRPPHAVTDSRTRIELLETAGALARYRLHPLTGKRHQLRVHMAALGLPIVGDRIYPVLQHENSDDLANPLRLLAERLEFVDPVTGQARCFESRRSLEFPLAEPLSLQNP